MMIFAAVLFLMLVLVAADLWLGRRRRMHDDRVRAQMAAYARRLQQDWDARPK